VYSVVLAGVDIVAASQVEQSIHSQLGIPALGFGELLVGLQFEGPEERVGPHVDVILLVVEGEDHGGWFVGVFPGSPQFEVVPVLGLHQLHPLLLHIGHVLVHQLLG